MKIALTALLVCAAYTSAFSQIQVGVWTDKTSYLSGDTVGITITAYNPGADTVVLNFGSSCQVSYTLTISVSSTMSCARPFLHQGQSSRLAQSNGIS
jgi:hypothetical protein